MVGAFTYVSPSQQPCEGRYRIPISHVGEETSCFGPQLVSDKLILRPKWVSWLCNLCKVDQQSVTSMRTSRLFPLWTSLIAPTQCCRHYLPVYLLPSLVCELHRSWDLGLIPHAPCRVPGICRVEDFVVRWLSATFEKWMIWKCVTFGLWTSPPVFNSREVFP